MNKSFWQGKKVFVTGHTGFKGSWLSVWLQKVGADVVGYSLPPLTEPAMFNAAKVTTGITSIEGDVRDVESVTKAMQKHKPEIVIHMAAQALVKTAYADPMQTYTTNVIGTLSVLEAVRKTDSIRVVVSITSDKCYENLEWVWGYRENDRMGGHDPYSSSKGCAELLISSYRDSYFPPEKYDQHGVLLSSTRAGNVIGGGDWSADRLVPDTMKAITQGESVLIRRPHAIRPWQFVLEPLRGYLDLAERLWEDGADFVGAWNFGPDIEQIKPVSWIVEYLVEKWGEGASWILDEGEHPHEDHFLKLDTTKAKSLLDWTPRLPLPTVLDWIVEWYQGYANGEDVRDITHKQIERYENIVCKDR
jgi:CDP-glucose 4,6-dehydratase